MSKQLYEKIAHKILNDFKSNSVVGFKLPSQIQLSKRYYVSRSTIVKAIDYLEEQNLVYTLKGKGSFLSEHFFDLKLTGVYSFDLNFLNYGLKVENTLVSLQVMTATDELQQELMLTSTDEVYEIVRIKKIAKRPLFVQINYLPRKYFEGLDKLYSENQRLYPLLAEKYNIILTDAIEKIRVSNPKKEIYKLLEEKNYNSCIMITRVSFENEKVVEYTKTYTMNEQVEFSYSLKNKEFTL